MSWLARSLANSLRIDDDDDDDTDANDEDEENDVVSEYPNDSDPAPSSTTKLSHQDNNDGVLESEEAQSRGVKEDLSELKQTLTRQLWGVASFLAPPPSSSQSQPSSPSAHSDLRQLRFDDSAQILTKMNTDSFGSKIELESDLEEHGFSGVGIIDEVLTFARNIKMHPKT